MTGESYSREKHMQQTQCPPKTRWHTNRAPAPFAIGYQEYVSLAKFSSKAEAIGVRTTAIDRGPFKAGARLTMSSGSTNYELDVHNGVMVLGKLESNGKRIRICEGRSGTQLEWERLFLALRKDIQK
jgi:hypothetical protein